MEEEFFIFLLFLSFLLSFLLYVIDIGKVGKNFSRRKFFSIVSVIFLFVLGLCIYFIFDAKCGQLFNPLLFLVFPLFLGFVIWSFIYVIKYKIGLGKIIVVFDVLIFVLGFILRRGAICPFAS